MSAFVNKGEGEEEDEDKDEDEDEPGKEEDDLKVGYSDL